MNMRVRHVMISALALAAMPNAAFAKADEARTCRGALSVVGQRMFDVVSPHVRSDSNLADLLRTHVRPLVMSGALSRSEAQANAPAVGACLRLLQG
jgi:hypothetical protein